MPNLLIREIIRNVAFHLQPVIGGGASKFIIYTNGMGGKLVREYLETEFGIIPEYIIDNNAYNGKNILSIPQAKERDNSGAYFLICSWHPDYYDEIRQVIYEAFSKEQIIDLFPHNKNTLPTDEEILSVLRHIDGYIDDLRDEFCS